MSNLNMPVKFCTDENGNPYSPVVYQESMFNDDASRMDPVPRKMFAKAYDPTKTYPTENLFCIQDNKYYKFTGSGTTTGTFDPTKWTETDDATELTALNSTIIDLENRAIFHDSLNSGQTITIRPQSGSHLVALSRANNNVQCLLMYDYWSNIINTVIGTIPSGLTVSKNASTNDITIANGLAFAIAYTVI